MYMYNMYICINTLHFHVQEELGKDYYMYVIVIVIVIVIATSFGLVIYNFSQISLGQQTGFIIVNWKHM